MIYIDSSCLIKLIREEPETPAVTWAIGSETEVIISSLTELEATINLKAKFTGGDFSLSEWRKLEIQLRLLKTEEPFILRPIPARVWETAFRQHRNSDRIHCRTLDRLHLAAMEIFGVTRLMTHDKGQARAAAHLGYAVLSPGREPFK